MGFVITARSNERIKQARGLMQAKARRERGLHLIEGEKLVLEAAQSGCALSELFVEDGYGLPEPLSALSGLVQPVSRSVMESLCSSTTPQHLCAVVKTPELTPPQRYPEGLVVVLDRVQDPGNVGTILRTADALQIPAVLLDGCADPYNPKTVRASMGAVFRTQPVRMTRQQAIAACRDAGIPLLATAMSADAVDLRQAELPSAAVIIGSEGQGICQELFDAAQGKIIIPMSPRCESLNAAVAAAIVLWQMKR